MEGEDGRQGVMWSSFVNFLIFMLHFSDQALESGLMMDLNYGISRFRLFCSILFHSSAFHVCVLGTWGR